MLRLLIFVISFYYETRWKVMYADKATLGKYRRSRQLIKSASKSARTLEARMFTMMSGEGGVKKRRNRYPRMWSRVILPRPLSGGIKCYVNSTAGALSACTLSFSLVRIKNRRVARLDASSAEEKWKSARGRKRIAGGITGLTVRRKERYFAPLTFPSDRYLIITNKTLLIMKIVNSLRRDSLCRKMIRAVTLFRTTYKKENAELCI